MGMRIKLLYPPRAHGADKMGPPLSRIPLLALPILKTMLTKRGFHTDIDDLDIRAYHAESQGLVNMNPFLDEDRVKRFIHGGEDEELLEQADRLLRLTKTRGYDIIGFSIMDEFNISCLTSTLVLSKVLRERTGCYVAVGGGDISCLKNNFSREELESCLDLVSFESPQLSPWRLVELARILDGQKPEKPSSYSESHIHDNYGVDTPPLLFSKRLSSLRSKFSQQPYEGMNIELIDSIDIPDFHGLPLEHYTYLPPDIKENFSVKRGILVLPYVFSINCPYACAFCGNSLHGTQSFVSLPAETIAEQLATLSRRHRTRYFRFMNDNINPNKKFAREFIKALKDRDLDLVMSDCANLMSMDKDLLQGFYDVGVRKLIYGLESPNDKMLRYINKGNLTVAHARECLIEADRVGIWNEAEIICGMPFETPEIVDQTITFMKEMKHVMNYWWVHKYKLLSSLMLEYPKRFGLTNVREPQEEGVQGWAFDEIGGLAWPEKYKQIAASHGRVLSLADAFEKESGCANEDESHIRLYMLYTLLGNKKEVAQYMKTHTPPKIAQVC